MFTTSTVATILSSVLTGAGDILTVNLPTIFLFLLSVAAAFWAFRWVRGVFGGRRGRRR